MCSCRGGYEGTGCEGGPECLDDEGGPLPERQPPPEVPGQEHTGWWCEHLQVEAGSEASCPQGCTMIPMYKWADERMREAFHARPVGPATEEEREAEKQKLLWACKCGTGGAANLVFYCDPAYARAEVERQVVAHLREEPHAWRHVVHVGTFTESFLLTPPPPSQQRAPELGWRKAGDEPDAYGPHPYLS